MPTYDDPQGRPVVEFQPELEVAPFAVFRALRDGREVLLVDAREQPKDLTLSGAVAIGGPEWTPPDDAEKVVLFDDDGSEALPHVERLIAAGHDNVRALFGGLELYEFALDPQVVGADTFLVRMDESDA